MPPNALANRLAFFVKAHSALIVRVNWLAVQIKRCLERLTHHDALPSTYCEYRDRRRACTGWEALPHSTTGSGYGQPPR